MIVHCIMMVFCSLADNSQGAGDTSVSSSSSSSKKTEAVAQTKPKPPPAYNRSASVNGDPIRSKCIEMLETSLTGDGGESELISLVSVAALPNPADNHISCILVILLGLSASSV